MRPCDISDQQMTASKPHILGVDADAETRCVHYHSALDVIAIRMACCGVYYACKDCHEVLADHALQVWPRSAWNVQAILCGTCAYELTIHEYMGSGYVCPRCKAGFNPGCRKHYHFYFAREDAV